MIYKGRHLTPAPKHAAWQFNYTWYNGKGDIPIHAGYCFTDKAEFAEQIYKDYPDGLPAPTIKNKAHTIGEGTIIGGEGFGWYGNPPKRFPHIGGVSIGTNVEIGSNVTIDRGALSNTIIFHDVKIDNGVHVGHNAVIREGSILTAHCVIGGSARIGVGCWIGLGALIKNQIRVGNNVTVGMGAVVLKDVPDGVTVVGNPARILEK